MTISDDDRCLLCGGAPDPNYSGCYECDSKMSDERKLIRLEAERNSGFVGGLRAWEQFTFEKFKRTDTNAKAIEAVQAFDPRKAPNLYIVGPTGTGKSHLAVAAARKFIGKMPVFTLKMYTLAREIRSVKRADVEHEILQRYIHAGVLIVDDLGVSKDTEFSTTLMYELIDGRYMNKPGGLIVTSNLPLDALAEKLGDDRIPSRLAQMCAGGFVSMNGEPDRRVVKP